jgi:hypothetical protein
VFSNDLADLPTGLLPADCLMARVSSMPTSKATAMAIAGFARIAAVTIRMMGVICPIAHQPYRWVGKRPAPQMSSGPQRHGKTEILAIWLSCPSLTSTQKRS